MQHATIDINQQLYIVCVNARPEDASLIRSLIDQGADPNFTCSNIGFGGYTPLYMFASSGNVECVNALLSHATIKANVNQPVYIRPTTYIPRWDEYDNAYVTPLFVAAHKGHANVVSALLNAKADVDHPFHGSKFYGQTALHIAVLKGHVEVVRRLLAAGADVNKTYSHENITPLFDAAMRGDINIVKLLLANGADPHLKDRNGFTIHNYAGNNTLVANAINEHLISIRRRLAKACQDGKLDDVVKLLEHGENPNDASPNYYTPLTAAANRGYLTIINTLLQHVNKADVNLTQVSSSPKDNGVTALYMAATQGHLECVNALLAANADINKARPSDNSTPLHMAAQDGHLMVVKALLDAKADINIKTTDYHETSLVIAITNGHLDIVKMLLAYGANPCLANNEGKTPLSLAKADNRTDIVQALLPYLISIQHKEINDLYTKLNDNEYHTHENTGVLKLIILKENELLSNITEALELEDENSYDGHLLLTYADVFNNHVFDNKTLEKIRDTLTRRECNSSPISTYIQTHIQHQLHKHVFLEKIKSDLLQLQVEINIPKKFKITVNIMGFNFLISGTPTHVGMMKAWLMQTNWGNIESILETHEKIALALFNIQAEADTPNKKRLPSTSQFYTKWHTQLAANTFLPLAASAAVQIDPVDAPPSYQAFLTMSCVNASTATASSQVYLTESNVDAERERYLQIGRKAREAAQLLGTQQETQTTVLASTSTFTTPAVSASIHTLFTAPAVNDNANAGNRDEQYKTDAELNAKLLALPVADHSLSTDLNSGLVPHNSRRAVRI